jgi:hypothetical protein
MCVIGCASSQAFETGVNPCIYEEIYGEIWTKEGFRWGLRSKKGKKHKFIFCQNFLLSIGKQVLF